MQDIRPRLHGQGFSNSTTNLLMNSWRSTETQKACNTYISKQKEYAHKYSISRLNPLVTQVSNFFAEMFQSGAGYGAVNITRSALSAFLGNAIGSHPNICRLVKGVFEECPALPWYSDTWDVDCVLDYLSTTPGDIWAQSETTYSAYSYASITTHSTKGTCFTPIQNDWSENVQEQVCNTFLWQTQTY